MRRAESIFRIVIILLATYLFSLGTTFNGVIVPDLKFFNLIVMTVFSCVWLLARWRGSWRWHITPLDLIFTLWGAVIVLSIVSNSDAWRRSMIGVWYIAFYAVIWFMLSDMLTNKRLKRDTLIDGLLFAGIIILVFGYVQIGRSSFDLASLDFPRPGSLIGNPNSLGAFLIVLLAFSVARFLYLRNRLARIILGIYGLLCGALLFLTFSRGAWLGAGSSVMVLIVLHARQQGVTSPAQIGVWWGGLSQKTRKLYTGGVATILLIGIIGGVLLLQSLSISGRTTELRTRIWSDAMTLISEKPITGHGIFQFGRAYERVESMPPFQPHSHAHNLILHITVEMGLVGLLVTVVSAFWIIRVVDRNWREAPSRHRATMTGAYMAMIGFGVHHLLDTPMMMPAIALAGLLVLLIAIIPAEFSPMQANWRRLGHPIGLIGLITVLLVSGFWSTNVYRDYANALLLVNDDDYRGAADGIQSAIDADPYLAVYHEQQAFLYGFLAQNGNSEDLLRAIAGYERFLELEPYSATGWANLGALYWQAERPEDAINAMQTAVDNAPSDWRLAVNLGRYYEESGDETRARDVYEVIMTERISLYPFWQETALRRDLVVEIWGEEITFEAILTEFTESSLRGRFAGIILMTQLVELQPNDDDLAVLIRRTDDFDTLIVRDIDRAFVDIARAELARAYGDEDVYNAELDNARERIAYDIAVVDDRYGANIGNFQFLRFVIPRRFLPQVYYPVADPLILSWLENSEFP